MGETAKRVRVGINGFGRMGRLALRAAFGSPGIEFAHINEIAGDASVGAHLLEFDVLHEGIGIRHGAITTLHDLTNTQTIVDAPHKDLRRARAAGLSQRARRRRSA